MVQTNHGGDHLIDLGEELRFTSFEILVPDTDTREGANPDSTPIILQQTAGENLLSRLVGDGIFLKNRLLLVIEIETRVSREDGPSISHGMNTRHTLVIGGVEMFRRQVAEGVALLLIGDRQTIVTAKAHLTVRHQGGADDIITEKGGILLGEIILEMDAVEFIQTIFGGHPQKTVLILRNGMDIVTAEAIFHRIVVKSGPLHCPQRRKKE